MIPLIKEKNRLFNDYTCNLLYDRLFCEKIHVEKTDEYLRINDFKVYKYSYIYKL